MVFPLVVKYHILSSSEIPGIMSGSAVANEPMNRVVISSVGMDLPRMEQCVPLRRHMFLKAAAAGGPLATAGP